MENRTNRFRAADILLIVLTLAPLVFGMALKILYVPANEEIEITGAAVFTTVTMPFGEIPITEAQINSWLVILSVFWFCLYLTHGISVRGGSRRQQIAEWAIEKVQGLVRENMGEHFAGFTPFVMAILVLSAFSSLLSLLGLYPPTSDLNVVAGWAILVFILITYYKCKCGPVQYMKSFAEPVPFLAPLNIISEVATPVSMAFRHYGNILSGYVISVLVAAALGGLTQLLLGWMPGALGEIPFLRIGVPAVLSVYFDVFSGCLQAFIFAMLTMLYVGGGFPAELYEKKQAKKLKTNI